MLVKISAASTASAADKIGIKERDIKIKKLKEKDSWKFTTITTITRRWRKSIVLSIVKLSVTEKKFTFWEVFGY